MFNKYVLNGKYKNGPFSYRKKLTFPQHFKPTTRDFLRKLLEVNPSKRFGGIRGGPLDIKNHPFFKVSSFPTSVIIQLIYTLQF
jgi:serine/threonine protein kinase